MQYMATCPRGFALVLVPVYFTHSVSCYIYYIQYCQGRIREEGMQLTISPTCEQKLNSIYL